MQNQLANLPSFMDRSIGLAPMEGVTDFPARLWFQMTGHPTSAGTPFVRVTDTYPVNDFVDEHIWPELAWARGLVKYELMPQLMASDPVRFAKVALRVLDRSPLVELNCGCPAPRAVGGGAGSSLLRDAEEFYQTLRTIKDLMPIGQLSVKIRTGFATDEDFVELIGAIQPNLPKRLVIHGRTRFQHYTGYADWGKIDFASRLVDCPVLGSGDITDAGTAEARFVLAPQVKGAVVGRGALRNPWVFDELRNGAPVWLERSEMVQSLAVYALLVHAYRHDIEPLKKMIMAGWFLDWQRLRGKFRWTDCYDITCQTILGRSLPAVQLDLPRAVLGRVKMFWNSLRTSLPQEAMEPTLLRSKSVGALFAAIEDSLPETFALTYRPEHDWLFAGQKRNH